VWRSRGWVLPGAARHAWRGAGRGRPAGLTDRHAPDARAGEELAGEGAHTAKAHHEDRGVTELVDAVVADEQLRPLLPWGGVSSGCPAHRRLPALRRRLQSREHREEGEAQGWVPEALPPGAERTSELGPHGDGQHRYRYYTRQSHADDLQDISLPPLCGTRAKGNGGGGGKTRVAASGPQYRRTGSGCE